MKELAKKIGNQDVIIYMDDEFYRKSEQPSYIGTAEGLFLKKIDAILNKLNILPTSNISLENYQTYHNPDSFSIDIVLGDKRIKLNKINCLRKKGSYALEQINYFSFFIGEGEYSGIYEVPTHTVYQKK